MLPPDATHLADTLGTVVSLNELTSDDLEHLAYLARKREERQALRFAELLDMPTIGFYLRHRDVAA